MAAKKISELLGKKTLSVDEVAYLMSVDEEGNEIPEIPEEDYCKGANYHCGICLQNPEFDDVHNFDKILLWSEDEADMLFEQANGIFWVRCWECGKFYHTNCICPGRSADEMRTSPPFSCCIKKGGKKGKIYSENRQ